MSSFFPRKIDIVCKENCAHWQECAQHCSAGDFRSDAGQSPSVELIRSEDNELILICNGLSNQRKGAVLIENDELIYLSDLLDEEFNMGL
jgi:hypothetical protein